MDGDDTLWRCQDGFDHAESEFRALLSPYADAETADRALNATVRRNLDMYGYGVKSFALSAIETASELVGPALTTQMVGRVLELGRELLTAPVELLPGASAAVGALRAAGHRLVLITKGDLVDQQRKLRESGLGDHFDHVEVVSDKVADTYRDLLAVLECPPERFLMVGNSPLSDVLPVVEIGSRAVYVPYHTTWRHEEAADVGWHRHPAIRTLDNLVELTHSL